MRELLYITHNVVIVAIYYSLYPQMLVAFDFYTNFDHSFYSKKLKL
jgi:hypothetical protein